MRILAQLFQMKAAPRRPSVQHKANGKILHTRLCVLRINIALAKWHYTETFAYYARFLPIVLYLKRVPSYAKRNAGTMCLSLRVKPKTWRISADAISMTTGPKISDELPLTNRINTKFYSMRNALLCNIALSLRRCIKTDSGQL